MPIFPAPCPARRTPRGCPQLGLRGKRTQCLRRPGGDHPLPDPPQGGKDHRRWARFPPCRGPGGKHSPRQVRAAPWLRRYCEQTRRCTIGAVRKKDARLPAAGRGSWDSLRGRWVAVRKWGRCSRDGSFRRNRGPRGRVRRRRGGCSDGASPIRSLRQGRSWASMEESRPHTLKLR